MIKVVGVRFRSAGKVYYFDPRGFEVAAGMHVIVETARGLEYGEVVVGVREVGKEEIVSPLRRIIRIATTKDEAGLIANRAKEEAAAKICVQKIADRGLKMSLVNVEYAFDGSKIIFHFTADGRVDFRDLVKDLATIFRTRIELRQIGVRDEAKMIGGIGPCGRTLCCTSHLSEFLPVSIKMAKQQNLTLNPTKISGICGRLMCCLRYENDHYVKMNKLMPRIGREVRTPDGIGRVTSASIVKETVVVELEGNIRQEFPLTELEFAPRPKKQKRKNS